MAVKVRTERPPQTIKPIIGSLSNDLKAKASTAFQSLVSAIKAKHLS